jgi:hypothetical protein
MPKIDRQILLVATAVFLSLGCALAAQEPTATLQPVVAEPSSTDLPPTATPIPLTNTPMPPTATIEHFTRPDEPSGRYLFMTDSDSSITAGELRASGGDEFSKNRFERPFSAEGMQYRIDLDLLSAEVAFDDDWIYFDLEIGGPGSGGFAGTYAIELDLDADGDGDWLISAAEPQSSDWSTDGVRAWNDLNDDIGGENPMQPDSGPAVGDGYEAVPFDQGLGSDSDAAWARLVENHVQIAIRRTLIDGDSAFLWGGWAMQVDTLTEIFDLNDRFSFGEAGSPLITSDQYPVKELALVDNTCRMYFGFTPSGSEPGLCLVFGTIQNCTFHPLRMEPGGVMIGGQQEGGSILTNVFPGAYQIFDLNVFDINDMNPLILSVTLHAGEVVQVVTDGNGETWACP